MSCFPPHPYHRCGKETSQRYKLSIEFFFFPLKVFYQEDQKGNVSGFWRASHTASTNISLGVTR